MPNSPQPETEHRLTYRTTGYLVFSVFLMIFAAIVAFLLTIATQDIVKRTLIVLFAIAGAGAFWFLTTGLRRRRQKAWYLSFTRNLLRLNFHDYRRSSVQPKDAVLEIPRDRLIWIRRAKRTAFSSDDSDAYFVEMKVTHEIWLQVKSYEARYHGYWPNTSEQYGSYSFFEGDVFRVYLDVSRSPDDLIARWKLCDYPVADDYEISRTATPKNTEAVPHQRF